MTQYTMSGYELGTYMEIYFPKRTAYQPFLFDVLTKGFEIEHVLQHFLCASKRPNIRKFLGGTRHLQGGNPLWQFCDDASYVAYINKMRPFLYGYSMYEVDGVFKGSQPREPIIEERTQILRLMFRVDLDGIVEETETKELDRRIVRARVSDYLRGHNRDHLIDNAAGQDRGIYKAARAWRDELGFFVFGYVVYELCTHIEQLYEELRIGKAEDEIWVMNFANLELDRIVWPVSVAQSTPADVPATASLPR